MNRIRKHIGESKFLKEILYCKSNEDEMNIDLFSLHVEEFIQRIRDNINDLLNELMSAANIKVAMDVYSSDDCRIVFYNVDNKDERYALYCDEIRFMSLPNNINLGEINASKKEDILKVFNLYIDIIFKAFKSTKHVPLTDILSFNYSLLNGWYYFLNDKNFGYVLIERRKGLEENAGNVVYIDKVYDICTIKEEYIQEFINVKKSVIELLCKVKEELGIQAPEQAEGNKEVKELKKN